MVTSAGKGSRGRRKEGGEGGRGENEKGAATRCFDLNK